MAGFSIIIVTWNALKHLQNFLFSVHETKYPDFEIIIADNASTDGSAEWVRSEFPDIKIVSFDKNYGYCGGNNKAVPYAEKEILLFLNNDVQVPENWLNAINDVFEKDTTIAAIQPKIKSYKHQDYFEYAGAAGGFIDRFGYPFCRGRILDTVEKDTGQYDSEIDIAWASGAALAVRKSDFLKLGGFDEDFEFHMEEIDLCWRLWNSGKKVVFTPLSEVFHLGGGSLAMGSPRKVYYNFRNNLFMLQKNLPGKQLLLKLPVRVLLDIVAAFRALLAGKPDEFKAIAKAHYHYWGSWSRTNKKRIPKTDGVTGLTLPRVGMIWNYYVLQKKTYKEIIR